MSSVAAVHPRASSFPHRRRDARGGPRSRAVARAAPSSDSDRSFAIGSPVVAESSRRGALLGAAASALLLPARPAAADDLFCGYYTENKSVTPQWAFKTPWSEGVVDVSSATGVKDAKTFLRILGKQEVAESAGHLPVLCLHGGPGLGFKYMEACEILASDKREVASYDQLGCARSALRSAPRAGTFTPQLYAAELARLRTVAGLDKVHIVAHGWGAMLAIDHVLGVDGQRGVGGVASLTLVSLPPTYARLVADRRDALARLAPDLAEVLLDGDDGSRGANLTPAGKALYDKAWAEWIVRYESSRAAGACYAGLSIGAAGDGFGALREKPATKEVAASANAVFRDMTGGKYFTVDGALADWDADANGRLARLAATVPGVRIVRGENDALSSAAAREVYAAVTRPEMKPRTTFEEVPGAGSCVHLDTSSAFLEGVNQFIGDKDDIL